MKRYKIILTIIILNIIILILSGCITPTAPNIPDQGDGVNHNPIISDLSASPRTAFINQNITITCTASDQDGDTLTYSWSSSPVGTINGIGSNVTWKSPATEGTYTITCTVSDGKGGKDNKLIDIIVAVNGVEYQIPWSKAESNGWANPLGEGKELITNTAYDYDSGIYLNNHPGKKHMGIDTDGNEENDDVYPIARGTIRKIVRGSDPMNMVIIIEHTNSDNEYFFAIYGHVLAREDLREGIMVCKNIKLGDIKTAGSGPHLHFGINTSSEISEFYYGIYGWGRIPDLAIPSDYGWVDPIGDYLNNHLPLPTLPSLTPEEIDLIRKWGYGGDYVIRWPDGYVDVYDETNYSQMQEVLNQWNEAIGGPVILRLSSNPNSPVKVIFDSSLDEENLCGSANEIWGDDYAFSEITIKVNPSESCCGSYNIKYCLYLVEFNAVAGFNYAAEVSPVPFEDWSNFSTIPDTINTMVHALYKVPPGYYLGIGNPKMGYSPTIIENMQLGIDSGFVSNRKK